MNHSTSAVKRVRKPSILAQISNIACVVLFLIGAFAMVQSEDYLLAGLLALFALLFPYQERANQWVMRRFGLESHEPINA